MGGKVGCDPRVGQGRPTPEWVRVAQEWVGKLGATPEWTPEWATPEWARVGKLGASPLAHPR